MKRVIDFIKEKCTQEEIQEIVKELVPHDLHSVPRSWEEHAKTITDGYYINVEAEILETHYCFETETPDKARNVIPSVGLAEAFRAMMQLMSLRQAWIKSWKPDWNDERVYKYCIVFMQNSPIVDKYWSCNKVLSFPTEEMAKDFLECFKGLIEKAKVLI